MATSIPPAPKRAAQPSLLSPASRRAARETKFRFRGGAFKHATTNPILTALLAKPVNGVSNPSSLDSTPTNLDADKNREPSGKSIISATQPSAKRKVDHHQTSKRAHVQESPDEVWEHQERSPSPNLPSTSTIPSSSKAASVKHPLLKRPGSSSNEEPAVTAESDHLDIHTDSCKCRKKHGYGPEANNPTKAIPAKKRKAASNTDAEPDQPKKKRKVAPTKSTAEHKAPVKPASDAEPGTKITHKKTAHKTSTSDLTKEHASGTNSQNAPKVSRTFGGENISNKGKSQPNLDMILEENTIPNDAQAQSSTPKTVPNKVKKSKRATSEKDARKDVGDENKDPDTVQPAPRKQSTKRPAKAKPASRATTKPVSKQSKKPAATIKLKVQDRLPMPKLRAIDFNAYLHDGNESDDPLDCISTLD